MPEVYTALERGTVDCAITGTGTDEVTKGLYNLTINWSTAAYFVNLAWCCGAECGEMYVHRRSRGERSRRFGSSRY